MKTTIVIEIDADQEAITTLTGEFAKRLDGMDYAMTSIENQGILKALVHYSKIMEAWQNFDHQELVDVLEGTDEYREVELRLLLNALSNKMLYDPNWYEDEDEDIEDDEEYEDE